MLPVGQLLGLEPEGQLAGGGLGTVTAVADVAADVDGVVTTDGTGEGGGGVGLTEQGAAALDGTLTLPAHGADGARGEVLGQTVVEGLGGQVNVVLLGLLHGGDEQLHGHQLESLLLETGDDLTDQTTLDTVGLDRDKGTLSHDD